MEHETCSTRETKDTRYKLQETKKIQRHCEEGTDAAMTIIILTISPIRFLNLCL
jgi:hypothetical protein